MSKQLVTHVWCDHHEKTEEKQVDADSHSVTVDGLTVDIDLCPDCVQPLLELKTWLETYGTVETEWRRKKKRLGAAAIPPSHQADPAEGICPKCGKQMKHRHSMMQHMRNSHGISYKDWMAQQENGDAEPAAAETQLGNICPECGKVFGSRQGWAAHRARSHGYRTPAKEAGKSQ